VRVIVPAPQNEYQKQIENLVLKMEKEAEALSEEEVSKFLEGPDSLCQTFKEMINRSEKGDIQQNPLSEEILKEDFKVKLGNICNRKPKSKKDAIKLSKQLVALIWSKFAAADMRSCGLYWQTWKMKFNRISEGKWANSPVPSGLCNIMKLYELEKDPKSRFAWILTETRLAGDTKSPICTDVKKELMKPTRWLTLGPDHIKLPCDYIDWNKDVQMGDIFPTE
jgi:hypothetical protein